MKLADLLYLLSFYFAEQQIKFGYQRRGCKKSGHFKIKRNQGQVSKELLIDAEDNEAGQIYVILHELAHIVLSHLEDRSLTKAQKEVVADQVAKGFIIKWDLVPQLKQSKVYMQQNLLCYSQRWLSKRQISQERITKMQDQIETGTKIITQILEENEPNSKSRRN